MAGLVAALCAVIGAPARAQVPAAQAAEARAAIAAGNIAWGRARVAYDRAAFDSVLTPDFYVQIGDRRLTRAEFIEQISQRPPNGRLTRFDASVLTVRPSADGWVALIQEKLESEGTLPDGSAVRGYSLWITRDGWRKVGDRWMIAFSEAVDWEQWRNTRPPIAGW